MRTQPSGVNRKYRAIHRRTNQQIANDTQSNPSTSSRRGRKANPDWNENDDINFTAAIQHYAERLFTHDAWPDSSASNRAAAVTALDLANRDAQDEPQRPTTTAHKKTISDVSDRRFNQTQNSLPL